ncbi:MAG TPA: HAD-IA family hydrolase, partial [bacterium]
FLPRAAMRFQHIAVLSNDVGQWSRKLRDRHGLAQAIGPWVISGDVHLRKPVPEIYQVLLERLGVTGERIVFVDDRAANLDAALPFGIRTVWMALPEETAAGPQHRVIHALEDLLAMDWG